MTNGMNEAHPGRDSALEGDSLVVVEQRGSTRLLTLNRPRVRNALSRALSSQLVQALQDADVDPTVTVVLLTGAGGAFCSGVDLKDLAENGFNGSESVDGNCITQVANLLKPVIGLISGSAVTGGFELALACDLLIADQTARFADTHSRVGIVPGGGLTARLADAIGVRRARQMSATGSYIDSQTALTWGLVNEVVESDELVSRGWAVAEAFSAAHQPTLDAVWKLYDDISAENISRAVLREATVNRGWSADASAVAGRTKDIVAHGRTQTRKT
ncbi:enoyl-CoA hydratase [Rhodococcus oxybenzonivorans]|uniref:enoyl-CoA hydratase n=1 Tax=Rhodococcus oxybenzonivorans TaxID=1990687 RepID=UPI0029558F01|nr:enoyl-CoA hydratase [Rhodococcus oxybenzonivorans]MDV7352801.1 enoyl-CoA hydratase [Rhodococcus oxybenzonivorans]